MSIVKPEFLSAEGYLVGVRSVAMTARGITIFQKDSLVEALWAYGEDDLLVVVGGGLTKEQVSAIGVRHARFMSEADPSRKNGSGYPHDTALALAAVEVLEGTERGLSRKRRRVR